MDGHAIAQVWSVSAKAGSRTRKDMTETATVAAPITNMTSRPIFCRLGMTKPTTAGMGRASMTPLVTMLRMAMAKCKASWSMQVPPRMVLSQLLAMGLQPKIRAKTVPSV